MNCYSYDIITIIHRDIPIIIIISCFKYLESDHYVIMTHTKNTISSYFNHKVNIRTFENHLFFVTFVFHNLVHISNVQVSC